MSKDFNEDVMAGIAVAVLTPILLAVVYILNGWVIFNYWGWFVLPVFETLPVITLAQAVGLSLVSSLFKTGTYGLAKDENVSKWSKFGMMLFAPVYMVILGWVVHSLIY